MQAVQSAKASIMCTQTCKNRNNVKKQSKCTTSGHKTVSQRFPGTAAITFRKLNKVSKASLLGIIWSFCHLRSQGQTIIN